MKTLREHIYSILEFVSGFKVTDDNPYDEMLIAKKIGDVRSSLIKQEYLQNNYVNDLFYQQIILPVLQSGIGGDTSPTELHRFYVKFPSLLPNVGYANIRYLGKVNLAEKFNRRTFDSFASARGRRWSGDLVDYAVIGLDKAFIRNELTAEKILLIGLFQDPTELTDLGLDANYPVPDPFKLEMIVKQDILAGLNIPPDEKNDAKHNLDEMHMQRQRR